MVTAIRGQGRGALIVRHAAPLSAEAPISALGGGVVTATELFYIRNHYSVPALDAERWRLQATGLVNNPLSLSLRDLMHLPTQTMTVTLECAGNGRSMFDPPTEGEQWSMGAVSTAKWTGVPLAEVLDRSGLAGDARELVFHGADGFARSLSLDDAQSSSVLLAYGMNGAALPVQHGYPLRVIVPGWYGVADVKWLTEIETIARPFDGYFQGQRYMYKWERNAASRSEPVRHQKVRSLITLPEGGQTVDVGNLTISGLAWSGMGVISQVEVSVNDGEWRPARLLGRASRHCWRRWELTTLVERPGEITIRSRATDRAGHSQPERGEWNRLGYGNNAIQRVVVSAV